MENIKLCDIINFTKGKYNKKLNIDMNVNFISNDSRTISNGWVYIALKGDRLDGHDFIDEAIKNGAVAVISEKEYCEKCIVVENSYLALKDISIAYKNKYNINYLAVTGSSGKTTTKDLLYYAFNENEKTLRNIGNFNSEVGLPMTILNLDKTYKNCICEMGMYYKGDINYLAEIVRPNVAIITNVGTAHIKNLGSRENILDVKMEISNYMTDKDTLIINGDNDLLKTIDNNEFKFNILRFGFEEYNDIKVLEYKLYDFGFFVKAKIIDEIIELEFDKGSGKHNILNCISVLGACKVLGYDLKKSVIGIQKYEASKYRMEKFEIGNKIIINDSYNANPDSMMASIETLKYMSGKRKVAILADMLELGEDSSKYHFQIGQFVSDHADILIAIGQESKKIIEGAKSKNIKSFYFDNNKEAKKLINSILKEGDIVLIKGSRGMKLEEVADSIC